MGSGKMRVLIVRVVAFFTAGRRDTRLTDEIQAHLDSLTDEHVRRGMSLAEARTSARREFGGVEQVKEAYRHQRGLPLFDAVRQDCGYAVRTLRKTPSFTCIAVMTLTLGIGANTAIFSLLDAVLLKSLPLAQPDELFVVRKSPQGSEPQRFSHPAFERFREVAGRRNLAAMSRIVRLRTQVDGTRESEATSGQLVSGEYFSTLGISAELGRMLTREDDLTIGGHPVAVLAYGFWQRRFAGSPSVLGQQIRLNGSSFTVVGVGPRSFSGVWVDRPVDVWLPMMMQHVVRYAQNYSTTDGEPNQPWIPQEGVIWLDVIGRTSRHESPRLAAALNASFQETISRFAPQIPDLERRRLFMEQRLVIDPFGRGFSSLREQFAAPLVVLMGMVAVVLMIACANVANLQLARGAARRRELAVRLSIGASRSRVIQQLLVESLLLSGAGGAAGLAVAYWTNAVLVRMAIGANSGSVPPAFVLDVRVFGFAAALSMITGVVFGLVPAFRTTQIELGAALKTGTRTSVGHSRDKAMKPLVAVQVAFALVLLVGAGLFGRSLVNLYRVDLGFDRDHLLAVWINPRLAGYSIDQLPLLYDRLTARLEAVPGVRSAALSMCGLVSDCRSTSDGFEITGYVRRPGEEISLQVNIVGPKYFQTVGIGLLEGREFDVRDSDRSPRVAIVNEATVRRYFGNRRALGQRFGIPQPDSEIVGIVRDARVTNPHDPAVPMAYYPIRQAVTFAGSIDVRAVADPRRIASEVRKAVADVDPNLPVLRVSTAVQQTADVLNRDRTVAALSSTFGALALLLSCIGLYGVISYGVARRTPELGVRVALGASRWQILGLVLRESLACVCLGVAAGLVLVLGGARFLMGLLFGLAPTDPPTFLAASLILVVVGSFAGYLPARRASRVDPMVALRHE
jgi:predicted permease